MVATRRSQDYNVKENFFAYRRRDLERKRNRAQAARAKKVQMEAKKPIKRNRAAVKLLARYEKWQLPRKLKFAANGYRFYLKDGKPAIEMCKTSIKTVQSMNNGVRATDVLPYLPK